MPNDVWGKRASGTAPDSGAIFMSNRSTMDECFERQLFGLPHAFAEFVKLVKAGMVLFLFEYEQRKLYGVFRAVSDGRMDIVSCAYHLSGRKFPAQVQFSVIWNCPPLSEHEFHDAIKENYFAARKFNFGLSIHQVRRLLYLFHSKMIRVQKSLTNDKDTITRHNASDKAYALVESLENSVVVSQLVNLVDAPSESSSPFQHPFTSETSNLLPSVHESIVPSIDTLSSLCSSSRIEPEHIDVSSSVLGDYIPLSSPEQFEPTETEQDFSEDPCEGHNDLSMDEACIYPRSFGVRESNQSSSVFYADNCDDITLVHQGDNSPRVKGLYSDISDIKGSVFSRLKLECKASVEKNENPEMTESVHEIMNKLHLSRKSWVKEGKKFESDTREIRRITVKKRSSVFSRLSVGPEHVERKDICIQLASRAAERFPRKSIRRGCVNRYDDVKKWNTWSRDTAGKDDIAGAVSEKKPRLVSAIVKMNVGSCEDSAKSDKTGDNEKDTVSAVIGPAVSEGNGKDECNGLTNWDSMLGMEDWCHKQLLEQGGHKTFEDVVVPLAMLEN